MAHNASLGDEDEEPQAPAPMSDVVWQAPPPPSPAPPVTEWSSLVAINEAALTRCRVLVEPAGPVVTTAVVKGTWHYEELDIATRKVCMHRAVRFLLCLFCSLYPLGGCWE